MSIVTELKPVVLKVLNGLYDQNFNEKQIAINTTNPEFEGDYTLVLFSFLKTLKKKPEDLGKEIGDRLVEENPALISSYNVIKGFLNLTIADRYWKNFLANAYSNGVEAKVSSDQKVMVEYASPNTNKPLHLGHLRNIFLGWSTAQILKNQGNDVFKSCIYNDRGIHICKSMVMWKDYANGATPETTSIKGDHLVGDYYVMFGDKHKEQVQTLVADGMSKEEADKNTPMMKEAQQMLLAWEQGDEATVSLWKKMNSWVYAGFNETYHRIRADFDKNYFESQTYLLGKEFVQDGLKSGVFFQKEDGSVWIDLTSEGLDET